MYYIMMLCPLVNSAPSTVGTHESVYIVIVAYHVVGQVVTV